MNTRIVVLAGGKSTRMNSGIPKVLAPLRGKPMIQYLLDAIRASGIDSQPVVVIGKYREIIKQTLGEKYVYVIQEEQRGTGHAVQCTEGTLKGNTKSVIVLYGDHPFVHTSTITKLKALHEREGCVLSMMTTTVEDFNEWRTPFYDFGRVIRDESRKIAAITEVKDATPAQREIREVNPSFFCFQASWLWTNLKKLDNNNAKHEYYLTDLVRIAIDEGECIASMDISPLESIGINTPEHLEFAKQLA